MSIPFTQLPSNTLVPGSYVEFNNSRAIPGLTATTHRLLVFGQMTSSGTADANTPVLVSSVARAVELFGRGANLTHMVEAVLTENPYTELWCVPLEDNAAGTAASGTIAVTASSAIAGTINLYIAGRRIQVAVSAGDAANDIAAAINTAITAGDDLPVTSTVSTNTVTITARHKGEIGNEIKLALNLAGHPSEVTPSGVSLAITQLASGATNPVITTALTNVPEQRYTFWLTPWNDTTTLNAIDAELEARYLPTAANYGINYGALRNSYANLITAASTHNKRALTLLSYKASGHYPAYIMAAAFMAAHSFLVAAADVATPVTRLALKSVKLTPADQFTWTERNNLLNYGYTTYTVEPGGTVYLERAVSTYSQNSSGQPDPSYREISQLLTLAYIALDWQGYQQRTFSGFKVGSDADPPTLPNVIRPKDMKAELDGRAALWFEAGLITDLNTFIEESYCEINPNDPSRIDSYIPANLINGLYVMGNVVMFRI